MASTSTAWGTESHTNSGNLTVEQVDGDGVFAVTVPGIADRSVLNGHSLVCSLASAGLRYPLDAAMFTYEVLVPEGVDWGLLGWKLPGLAGNLSGQGSELSSGGTLIAGSWSGRLMVHSPNNPDGEVAAKAGRPYGYLYVPEVNGVEHSTYGQGVDFSSAFVEGEWNTIGLSYRMNTPGRADGVFMGMLNGVQAARSDRVRYRTSSGTGISHLWHHVYAGGSGAVGPASSQTLKFRNHRISADL